MKSVPIIQRHPAEAGCERRVGKDARFSCSPHSLSLAATADSPLEPQPHLLPYQAQPLPIEGRFVSTSAALL